MDASYRGPLTLLWLGTVLVALSPPACGEAPVTSDEGSADARAGEIHALLDACRARYDEANYSEVRRLAEETLAILEQTAQADAGLWVRAYQFAALAAQVQGDYSAARRGYERTLEVLEADGQAGTATYASALGYLAYLRQVEGDLPAARELHLRVLALLEELRGADDVSLVRTLVDLGYLQRLTGDVEDSIRNLERARRIQESQPQRSPGDEARIHQALATSLEAAGRLEDAMEGYTRATELFTEAYGEERAEHIPPLAGLAGLLRRNGRYEAAAARYEKALELAKTYLGPDAPEIGELQYELGLTLAHVGRAEDALELALLSAANGREHFRAVARTLPERQALVYLEHIEANLDLAFSLIAVDRALAKRNATRLWEAEIRARALVLDEMALRQRTIRLYDEPEVRRLSDELREARRDRLAAGVPGETRERCEGAEQALAEAALGHRDRGNASEATLARITKGMPPDTALVAFAQIKIIDLTRKNAVSATQPTRDTPTLFAFVWRPGASEIALVDLGAATAIDSLVQAWRREASVGHLRRRTDPQAALAAYRRAGAALRKAVWDPLVPRLGEVGRVLVVPDGSLGLVAFPALPTTEDRYLIDEPPAIHVLSAERDVVLSVSGRARGNGLLAVGGVDFDRARAPTSPPKSDEAIRVAAWQYRGAGPLCPLIEPTRWSSLPGTTREIDAITRLWSAAKTGPTSVLRGPAADETSFKQLASGHRVLHLSTHGFFYNGRCAESRGDTRGVSGLVSRRETDDENLLLLSGLVFAGANVNHAGDEDDGILTAEEIATLNLDGVEWAVLSACDTGLGRIQVGEGVLGLRRAFRIAGAGTVIMSLWSVDDESSRAWMEALYTARLVERLDTIDAVRAASMTMLTSRRESGESTHPFFWAGFIAAGDWQ